MPIDYHKYPPNWKTEIRPAILKRAGNKCEWCGVENHTIIKKEKNGIVRKIKIVLTIAHLNHDKSNHKVSLDRLAALCQKCHLRYDIKRHIANRKYGRNYRTNNLKLDF